MWPIPASSSYRLFLSGQSDGLRIATITWDASALGWGAAICTDATWPPDIVVGTFSLLDIGEFNQPTYREARAGALALRAASQQRDLSGWTVILRNDCTGALANLRKGCLVSESIHLGSGSSSGRGLFRSAGHGQSAARIEPDTH